MGYQLGWRTNWSKTQSNDLPIDVLEQPSTTSEEKCHLLLLPYQGQKSGFALKSMRKRLKTLIPNNFNMQTAYNGKNFK